MTRPTFIARTLSDGTLSLRCRQTGDRFILADVMRQSAVYLNGRLILTGSRVDCIDEIEHRAALSLN